MFSSAPLFLVIYLYIYIYTHTHVYIHIYIYMHTCVCRSQKGTASKGSVDTQICQEMAKAQKQREGVIVKPPKREACFRGPAVAVGSGVE